MNHQQRQAEEIQLLGKIDEHLPRLRELWDRVNSHWGYEDAIYRFYHESFKVFRVQQETQEIVEALKQLAPHLPMNPFFLQIVAEGTGHEFCPEMNQRWLQATRPILEAFFHARYFLEMVCRYGGQFSEPPQTLPSGWASVLYLFDLR